MYGKARITDGLNSKWAQWDPIWVGSKLTLWKYILFHRIQHTGNCVTNESFPVIEFRNFYIRCQPVVLSMSALLSTEYMFVQDNTVRILIRDSRTSVWTRMEIARNPSLDSPWFPNLLNHIHRSLVEEEVQNSLFANGDILGDRIPGLRSLVETLNRIDIDWILAQNGDMVPSSIKG